MINKWGRPVSENIFTNRNINRRSIFIHCFFTALVAACCFRNITTEKNSRYQLPEGLKIIGYNLESLPGSIIKLDNDKVLVYIKRIAAFYAADHTPYICWRGSGYAFSQVEKEKIGGIDVYSGTLIKDNEQLYTCWWYQHDLEHTTNQFHWRWQMLKRKGNYSVVNVTAGSREKLKEEVIKITQDQPFRQLLQ
jgi:exosortase N